ncbi:hypothetical protein HYS00_04980, partial [Candidatus Microgenomates bacterium]|nr:hypothetical protein [Candidatus Microgenomates bacterium]
MNDSNKRSTLQEGNIIIGLLIGAVLALIPSYYFYNKYQVTAKLLKNPQQAARQEVESTVAKLGQLMVLPKDETPTIATVTDRNKLKEQPFFAKAENGDKVILYIKAKKAILFREKANKIIEVAPINIQKQAGTTPAPSGAAVTTGAPGTSPTPEAMKKAV